MNKVESIEEVRGNRELSCDESYVKVSDHELPKNTSAWIEVESGLLSNGVVSILRPPYHKPQHPNQRNGLDKYVDIIPHDTGIVNSVKLYSNTKGLHIKIRQGTFYLDDFTEKWAYVPFQMIKQEGDDE